MFAKQVVIIKFSRDKVKSIQCYHGLFNKDIYISALESFAMSTGGNNHKSYIDLTQANNQIR